MNLVIVESPTKSKTLQRFLGKDYKILSSYGHIRDLPKSKLGIDIEDDFKPTYVIIPRAKKNVEFLKKEINNVNSVILATDEDREGEAIAYHLSYILDLKNPKRIAFHEITKSAIEEAIKNPREIDIKLVNAQQARRFLDRIVGYKLSPFLWKKVARGLSAGRVQSVAVRLVVEREREIENFVPQEYWTINALFEKDKKIFEAVLSKRDGKLIPKLGIKNKKEADEILKDLDNAKYTVTSVEKKTVERNPLPPLTTSTLQQTAWQKFKFPAKMTMIIAQSLYERGFITYHRTDSLNLSDLALFNAKKFITENLGKEYWAGFPRKFLTKTKNVQEAHEAIRPTYSERTPEKLKEQGEMGGNDYRIYDLIWRRFVASQMAKAIFDSTSVEILAENIKEKSNYAFRASGQILKFEGFLRICSLKCEEIDLPLLEEKEVLDLIKLSPFQHFTQPPPRFTEATLIKALEEKGIGRPSTYVPILSTIQERNYVEKDEQKRFKPTEIGIVINDILVSHFPKIVDINFTAEMEGNLDEIANGKKELIPVMKEFYDPFAENLKQKYEEVSKKDFTETPTKKKCPQCKSPLLIRMGRFGKFYACSSFPKCKYTETLKENALGIKCPQCKKGDILPKRTKKRKIFYGCSKWPECTFASWDKPLKEKCKKCGFFLVETAKKQVKCSNKDCDFKLTKK